MAIQFRCETLLSRFQNPYDEAHSNRKLQVCFDPLLGITSRIAEGAKLQTRSDAGLGSFRAVVGIDVLGDHHVQALADCR